jgi:hypothetical protein
VLAAAPRSALIISRNADTSRLSVVEDTIWQPLYHFLLLGWKIRHSPDCTIPGTSQAQHD